MTTWQEADGGQTRGEGEGGGKEGERAYRVEEAEVVDAALTVDGIRVANHNGSSHRHKSRGNDSGSVWARFRVHHLQTSNKFHNPSQAEINVRGWSISGSLTGPAPTLDLS